ncbi:MAG: hypothetical protein FWD61_20505 [Phycisphaerales bacterium]|nr:hypothetical protein [Phycisphaerales bacterium]
MIAMHSLSDTHEKAMSSSSYTIATSGASPLYMAQDISSSYAKTGDVFEDDFGGFNPAPTQTMSIQWHYDRHYSDTSSLSGTTISYHHTNSDDGWTDSGNGPWPNTPVSPAPDSTAPVSQPSPTLIPGASNPHFQSDENWIYATNDQVNATGLINLVGGNPFVLPPRIVQPPAAPSTTAAGSRWWDMSLWDAAKLGAQWGTWLTNPALYGASQAINWAGNEWQQWGQQDANNGNWILGGLETGVSKFLGFADGMINLPATLVDLTHASVMAGEQAAEASGSAIVGTLAGLGYGVGSIFGVTQMTEAVMNTNFATGEEIGGTVVRPAEYPPAPSPLRRLHADHAQAAPHPTRPGRFVRAVTRGCRTLSARQSEVGRSVCPVFVPTLVLADPRGS